MKKINLCENKLMNSADPKTIEELEELYTYIENLLQADRAVALYYNVFNCLSNINKRFLLHYDKSEDEIKALIEKEGYTDCDDPYVRFIRKVTRNGSCFSENVHF